MTLFVAYLSNDPHNSPAGSRCWVQYTSLLG